MSKIMNKFSLGLTVAVGVALVAYYQSDSTIEDVGEQIALRLLEILPRKNKMEGEAPRQKYSPPPPPPEPLSNETKEQFRPPPPTVATEEAKAAEDAGPSKASVFDPPGEYDPKEAMQRRYDALKEACMIYADFMRPERFVTEIVPDREDLLLHPPSKLLFCPLDLVAKKSMNTFFARIREPGNDHSNKLKTFDRGFPRSASDKMRSIVVRHPLERIVAAYRHNFEKSYNAMTGEEEGGDISFPEFVDVIVNGHVEFAEFLEENGLGSSAFGNGGGMGGESVTSSAAIDTGMIDGVSGVSRSWNPYWRSCGICHPDFMPHFIIHLNHFKEDAAVLVEVMGHPRNSKDFLGTSPITPTSSMREVEEHYWSQVTKQDVRDLYEKYKVDHDIFGFTPEYYIAMAKPDAA